MQSYLAGLLSGVKADFVDIRLERHRSTRVEYRGKTLDAVGETSDAGGSVRALVSGGWGFVSLTDPERLPQAIDQAIAQARVVAAVRREPAGLADVPIVRDHVALGSGVDPGTVSLARKLGILSDYNRLMLEHGPDIKSTNVIYFDRTSHYTYASTEGSYIEQERMDTAFALVAEAQRQGLTQSAMAMFGGSGGSDLITGREREAADTAARAVRLLSASPVAAGTYTVVLDPELAGVFAHEAFGHLSEADDVCDNPRLRDLMRLGAVYGPGPLSIYDDGRVAGARGYLEYDDEGVATGRTYLIREGILVGRLHSRQSAASMAEAPTGNARAVNYRHRPICRMRTTAIEAGQASFEDMIRDIKLGVYARGTYGGETQGEMFTFSAGEAYMIRDGQLAELVRDVNLTGNVFDTLHNIDMVGRDFKVIDGPGGCGKGDQHPLPTSEASPHIRIRNVTVGGTDQ